MKDPKLKHDLVLFDFDGTLADSLPWLSGATARLAQAFNFRVPPPDEIERLRDGGPNNILSAMGIPLWKMPRIAAAMRKMMAEDVATIRLFDGIEGFIRRLHARGVRLGIVSSNGEANVRTVLGPATAKLFQRYECGVSLLGKAAKLRRAVKLAKAEHALYVGDEIRDFEAAEKAPMPFGAVGWGFSTVTAFEKRQPRVIFRSIHEMEDYLTG